MYLRLSCNVIEATVISISAGTRRHVKSSLILVAQRRCGFSDFIAFVNINDLLTSAVRRGNRAPATNSLFNDGQRVALCCRTFLRTSFIFVVGRDSVKFVLRVVLVLMVHARPCAHGLRQTIKFRHTVRSELVLPRREVFSV